ncbi:hypothetical protein H9N28_02985 [Rhodobacter capsulatus]|uniref:hypothetical protein n=1 Tax=Rhodobacter capsulatus TaxID=1061 RepID=UPI0006DC3F37|nr:hypothetical protein [Rhodobacter capsulatus]KQB15894.1 hypothetical protein AP071_13435 [Rhodobacter capsulatus]KQB16255.1 hypothetical protein AP073_11750 [Rhodobacter capsulatus]PZX21656.1 putative membrane protein [Rhodobacter capsulatus]QNR63827.1 hypothetical protein H9N28_02985 [Rhodobacter capsulatus]
MNGVSVVFAPLVPWPVLAGLSALAVLLLAVALWRGLKGWALRGLALLALLGGLAQPSVQHEDKTALSDIVLLVDDRSASQMLSDRGAQTDAALAQLSAAITALPNTELRRATVRDGAQNAGTQLGAVLSEALAAEPRGRVAGVVVLSDGRLHDPEALPDLPAPLHLLRTGHASDWDRRLVIETAPAFGIIGEETVIRLKVEDSGAVPPAAGATARLTISIDGAAPQDYPVMVGQDLELPLQLEHAGQNVVQFSLDAAPGQLTAQNDSAVVSINGVRDRLRVLLVSGQPHAGERTWRNLLKSDAGVDLVHFTILRPPEKQDGTPVSELSLIAFPTQELFLDKIDEFDLIIFDRYAERGILPAAYFENIRAYVERGGAVLVSAGPEFATVESLWQTPLGDILPARPTGRVLSTAFLPRPTVLGLRHPVTAGLTGAPPPAGDPGANHWGRWLRQIELTGARGEVVMQGAQEAPLLVLDRAGKGRVALLASDHAWLWDRGYEGGGPQLELLRRIAHWAMKEPDLEEEALQAEVEPGSLSVTITRRTMQDRASPVQITRPDGTVETVTLPQVEPGRFAQGWTAPAEGLYRLKQDDLERVVALGPASAREYETPVASGAALAPLIAASGGSEVALENGIPDLRQVRPGRVAAGRGWIGVTPREVTATTDIRLRALLPGWAWLALVAALAVAAWLIEGRRRGDQPN